MVPDPMQNSENGPPRVQAASLPAVFILSAPFEMVKVAIFSFLLGLAIYQGFVFTKDLDNDSASSDSRNNFIALMLGLGLIYVFFLVTFSLKEIASTVRSVSFRETERLSTPMIDATPQESKNEEHPSIQMAPAELPHEREQINEQQGTNSPQTHDLAALLEAAAQAHAQCAEADRRVALAFSGSSGL